MSFAHIKWKMDPILLIAMEGKGVLVVLMPRWCRMSFILWIEAKTHDKATLRLGSSSSPSSSGYGGHDHARL
jgi:hypothetical protein